jgi:hypothetical protein
MLKNIQGNKYKVGIRYRTNYNAFKSYDASSMKKHDGFQCGTCDNILSFNGFNHSIQSSNVCLLVMIHTKRTHVRWSSNPIKVYKWNFISFVPNVASIEIVANLWKSGKMTFTFLKWGLGSPPRLPKLQSSIIGVKTPHIEIFFISLKNYRSVDVENGLAWAIWTFAAQVMTKRKVGNQTGSLTPDH